MNQLILDTGGYAILLPESQKGGYTAYEEPLSVDLVMLPGNMVRELRGTVWRVNYQYGYFTDEEKNNLQSELERQRKFLAGVRAKLSNEKFTAHAPAAVIEGERKKEADALARIEALESSLNKL